MNTYIIQGIGFVALILVVLSFQKNSRSHTLIFLFLASFLFALHYFLLEAYTGAILNIAGALRAAIFFKRDAIKWLGHVSVMWIFIAIFSAAGLYTYREPSDILPVIAMIIESIALWNKNTRTIRYLFLSARPFWLMYNIINESVAGISSEIFLVISLAAAVWRFDIKKNINPHDRDSQ